jgi:hypothetical protein
VSHLDESDVLTITVTRDTDYEFRLVVSNPQTQLPEDLSDATEITFQFKDDESDATEASTNVPSALHNLGSTAAYVDTGAETLAFDATANTITRSAGDFSVDNFVAGQRIRVKGTASDGTYKVDTVAALVLTLETDDPDDLAKASTVTTAGAAAAGSATITAPVLAADDLKAGVITVSGPPSDLSSKELGSLFGAARILRGDGRVQQAPRRSARIRLES